MPQSITQAIASGNLNALAAIAAQSEKQLPEMSDIAKLGAADAKELAEAAQEADKTVGTLFRDKLVARAVQFDGDETKIRDYLSGYRQVFAKSGDVRASEARAVFMACAKDADKVSAYTGGYHGLIALCREIKGKANTGPRKSASGVNRVTDKGLATLEDKIKVLNPAQSAVVLQKAIEQVQQTHPDNWEMTLLRQIDGICIRLAQSKQPIFQVLAEEIQASCAEILNTEAISEARQQAATPAVAAAA